MQVSNNILTEAFRESLAMSYLHPSVIQRGKMSDFIAMVITGQFKSAKLVWDRLLRAPLSRTEIDMFLIQEIDDYLTDNCDV